MLPPYAADAGRLTGDHGPCRNSNEKVGRYRRRKWLEPRLRSSTLLMHEGSLQNGCYDPRKDVVVPTAAMARAAGGECPAAPRTVLAYFAGKPDSEVRRELIKMAPTTKGRLLVPGRSSHRDYLCAMAAAKFCLAPRGNAAWSPRLDEGIAMGCIPVLIADDYDPPFHHVLDYSAFSVRIPERNATSVVSVLEQIPDQRIAALQQNLGRVRL